MKDYFRKNAKYIDELDGISMSFDAWRFNVRISNTEPLVRLNVESNGDKFLLKIKIEELTKLIESDCR